MAVASNVDPDEIARFSDIAEDWWAPYGKFAHFLSTRNLSVGRVRPGVAVVRTMF